MKKLVVKKDGQCMACLECVRACSQAFYKEFHQDYSCIRIVAKGNGAKPNTCIQCGKCMRTCEHEAITQNPKTGVYMINKKKCVGCGYLRKGMPHGNSGSRGKINFIFRIRNRKTSLFSGFLCEN